MHLIRYCSVSGNKCGRLSDLVPSRHVSLGAQLCQPVCLRRCSPLCYSTLLLCSVCGFLPHSVLFKHGPFFVSTTILISSPSHHAYNLCPLNKSQSYLTPSHPFSRIASLPPLLSTIYPACRLVPLFALLCLPPNFPHRLVFSACRCDWLTCLGWVWLGEC